MSIAVLLCLAARFVVKIVIVNFYLNRNGCARLPRLEVKCSFC